MSFFKLFFIILASIVAFILLCWFISFACFRYIFRDNFNKLPPDETQTYKNPNFLKTVFIDFPRAFMYNKSLHDNNEWTMYGLHGIVGPQGCGKTITLCHLIRKYKYEFPKLLIKTNFDCTATKHRIHDFKDIDNSGNGIYGELDCISELQTWFDCLQSKNFPQYALATITQQRHVHRAIFYDSQVFNRVAKPIRENTYSIYRPYTLGGCFTIVNHYEPVLDDDGKEVRRKHIEWLWFVHDKELRSMYDSYSNVDYGMSVCQDK